MPSVVSVKLRLRGMGAFGPEAVRGLVYSWLRAGEFLRGDDAGALWDHDAPIKPLTIAPVAREAQNRFRLFLGVVDEDLLDVIRAGLEERHRLVVVGSFEGAVEPDRGHLLTEVQHETWDMLIGAAGPVDALDLAFLTPTTFRSGRRYVPNALPTLIFGHYRKMWRTFAPTREPDFRLRDLPIHPRTSDLRVERVPIRHRPAPGFRGRVVFDITSLSRPERTGLDLLSRLAPYCGTGANTTLGMGVTRKIG